LVPQRTLHRYCVACTDYRGRRDTVPVVDGEPGVGCQIDFAPDGHAVGFWVRPTVSGARVDLHRGVFAAHVRVLTFSQTLEAIIVGCEAAWRFLGGVFKVPIADNVKAIVAQAAATNPLFKPRVERMVQYVRGNFFGGEEFHRSDRCADPRPGLVSLHDGDARPIAKGRLGRPVEFGQKAQMVDNDDGVALDHPVEQGNPPDAPQLAPALARSRNAPGAHRARSPPTAAMAIPPKR
jgi:hypothetical protein